MDSPDSIAEETLEHVVISRAMAFTDGLQAEDFGVLIRVRLRAPSPFLYVPELLAELQASGWKITVHRLRESLRRLRKAGLIPPDSRARDRSRTPSEDAFIRAIERGRAGWAYAISDSATRLVKIGLSNDPKKRLRDLATGTPGRLELVWSREGGSALEAFLHRYFSDRHVRGEWFDFTGADAAALIGDAADKHLGNAS